jgi:flagellar basal-body rod protein FlgF
MNSGMYAALSGNLSAMRRLDVIANNLANASTPGYKGDQIQFESVLANVKNTTDGPVFSSERFSTDFSAGSLQKSDNPLDVALDGEGFFAVNTPQGTAYTRQGNFHRSADGKLVNADGYEVQGKNGGAISVAGNRIDIGANGLVTTDGVAGGTLATVDFPKPYALNKAGGGLFLPADPQAQTTASNAAVKQGYVETSNVKVVVEMARMIEASRYFESCAKAVKSYDDMAAKAANDLGKV